MPRHTSGSTSASQVTTPSMVAMLGWIMPLPLHVPPMCTCLPPMVTYMERQERCAWNGLSRYTCCPTHKPPAQSTGSKSQAGGASGWNPEDGRIWTVSSCY
eukprot:GHRQ01035561.1.p1 GENE.GHRQ01035561.1~~GHRQ01035561.1.p1  ORF type:complete len:101 (+),score=4.17 GHRQ01035561.1:152-454(+)